MPLKLTVAISRKIGQPNYGSRGATVGLEIEEDSSLVEQPVQLRARIVQLFRLAGQLVDQELGARGTMPYGCENGAEGCPPRYATPAQVRAIHAIANRRHLDLADELNCRFAVIRPEELLLEEASQLIDAIQTARNDLATGQHGGAAG
jgi:hypothetical protein